MGRVSGSVDRRGERPRCRRRSSCRWLVRCRRIRPASRRSSRRASDSRSTSTPSRRISRCFAGLDRYETVGWQLDEVEGRPGLRVEARPKTYAPPFLMLGISLQNTTTDDFAFQLAARYLTFDVAGSGSELRVDGAVGAQPNVGAELYRPIGRTPLFVAGRRGASQPDAQLRERRRRRCAVRRGQIAS